MERTEEARQAITRLWHSKRRRRESRTSWRQGIRVRRDAMTRTRAARQEGCRSTFWRRLRTRLLWVEQSSTKAGRLIGARTTRRILRPLATYRKKYGMRAARVPRASTHAPVEIHPDSGREEAARARSF